MGAKMGHLESKDTAGLKLCAGAAARTREAASHLDESGAARLALVRLFSRMDAGVSLEIGRAVKLGAADVAVVRLRTWSLTSGGSAFRIQTHKAQVGLL